MLRSASYIRNRDQSFSFQKIRDSIFHFQYDPNTVDDGKSLGMQNIFGKRDRVLSYLKNISYVSVTRFYSLFS